MRKLITICLFVLACLPSKAQEEALVTPSDSIQSLLNKLLPSVTSQLSAHMNLEFYTSAAAYFTEGDFDEAAFKINRVRLEILGSFSQNFTYHFRQSFNKYSNPHTLDNLSSSIEYAYVNWKLSPKLSITVGKQFLPLGGHEYNVNGIRIREFSEFNNHVPCYQAGIGMKYSFSPTQEVTFKLLNNRNGEDNDMYIYGRPEELAKAKVPVISALAWNGYFIDKALLLRYAAAWGQQAKGRNILYLTAGNTWQKGPILAYADIMYSRQGLDAHGVITDMQGEIIDTPITAQHSEYFTLIGNIDYRIHPNWNVYVKGAYETTGIYKANGPFEEGKYRTTWNVQGCVEFFPMRNSELKIFAHLLHKGHKLTDRARVLGATCPDTQRISLGMVYVIPVF
ncbi:MAG: OprO/OprP family phosphate-selective porin [Bacteroides sp.]|nr:OprO/OprP family phosphate-selective porin [Bacteroides sp.]